MNIVELSDPDAVRKAVVEFDELGRVDFLSKYGFGVSRRFVLEIAGNQYDSKAIAAAAYGFQFPEREPLRSGDFSGGVETTAPLKKLGFDITDLKAFAGEADPLFSEILQQVLALLELRSLSPEEFDSVELDVLLHEQAVACLGGWVDEHSTPKAGTGMGTAADVPWVGIFSPSSGGASAQRGVYPVYLFAKDGSACFLSLNQGTEDVIGGTKVLRKRSRDIQRIVNAPDRYRVKIDLQSKNARPARYEAGSAYQLEYSRDAVPDDDQLRSDLAQMLRYLTEFDSSGVEWHPEIEPLHLLFKWNADGEPRTLEIHKELAEAHGETWWGRFAQATTPAVAAGKVAQLQHQLDAGLTTHTYLRRRGSLWRATVVKATAEPPEDDDIRFPSYYRPADCNFFVLLRDFEELDPSWALENLVLASAPAADPARLSAALSNQTTPLFVYQLEGAQSDESRPEPIMELTLDWLSDQTLWPKERLEELLEALQGSQPQIILAGPPGTGKTFVARALARFLTNDESLAWRVVQFHPSYGYEEFIEGIQPVVDPETRAITFERRDGVILDMAANSNTHSTQVLIVDEMNRANLPRVFGELMYALEYRDDAVDLMYSKGFEMPQNLLLIGTMNTADRSIRSIDLALRRRFYVYDCPPSGAILKKYWLKGQLGISNLVEGFDALNAALTEAIDRHHTVGHTFFMPEDRRLDHQGLRRIWVHQVAPLIEEYFFDRPELVDEFTLERFWPAT